MKKNLLWIISIAVTGILLFFIFRKIDPAAVLHHLESARPLPLICALAISFVTNCLLASLKWRFIVDRLGLTLSFRESFLIKMGSNPIKSLLPFRSGETSRVIYLKRRHNFSAARTTGSILIELSLNILIFLIFIVLGGVIFRVTLDGFIYLITGGLGAVIIIGLIASRTTPRRWVKSSINRIPSPRLRGGLETFFTLHRFFSYREMGILFIYSLLIQSGKLFTFYLIISAFGLALPASIYFIILPFSILIATIPITLLGIGIREGSLVELVPIYSTISGAVILGPALIFSLVEYLFPALLGLFWTGRFTRGMLGGGKESKR
ncbi:MAG: lysylphosphatidylglycerol synthase transmembrane domain-containing protein [Candidatus Auribacterota bacterium]|nr:lysylphosphatidylglycerol synthase transmembrane domain-containing protein [Candidatus Auribacterota bacterium]